MALKFPPFAPCILPAAKKLAALHREKWLVKHSDDLPEVLASREEYNKRYDAARDGGPDCEPVAPIELRRMSQRQTRVEIKLRKGVPHPSLPLTLSSVHRSASAGIVWAPHPEHPRLQLIVYSAWASCGALEMLIGCALPIAYRPQSGGRQSH